MFVKQANIPDILPLLPVKDAVLFPNMVIPILVKTEDFVPMLEEVMEKDRMVVVAMMGDEEKAALEAGNFSRIGTVASARQNVQGLPCGKPLTGWAVISGRRQSLILSMTLQITYSILINLPGVYRSML